MGPVSYAHPIVDRGVHDHGIAGFGWRWGIKHQFGVYWFTGTKGMKALFRFNLNCSIILNTSMMTIAKKVKTFYRIDSMV